MIRQRIFLSIIALGLLCGGAGAAALAPGQEYFLWLNIYEKLLGSDQAGSAPALSAYGVNADADSYVFVAEDAGQEGYVLLRQKSTGRYLAASSTSSYSVVFETARATDARYCWAVDEGTYVYLVNKKNAKYLGVDGANKGSTYVAVYYDKPRGSHAQFSAIPATGSSWDEARAAYVSDVYTNAQGVREVDYCLLRDRTIERTDDVDIHVTANDNPIQGSTTIDLGSERTWLIIDNVAPSKVVSTYLKYVSINGKRAVNGTNCRVAIYLNGAAVIPLPAAPMTYQTAEGEQTLAAGNHTTLGTHNNTMTAFTLRRGYMATVASGTNGSGHSRVYVADHADLQITLPTALARRVSSVYIKPWQYLSKKGWASTGGAGAGPQVGATWFWSWSAGYSSTSDMEYVPCRQHLYWPSASDVNGKTASAALSLNEPEHSEQHTSSKCSCGGTISSWKAYTITDDFKAGGGRIGSPQPTDFSYLTEYCTYVDNMASRCDFTVTHAYWDISGRTESGYADWFVGQCKSIWTSTGRPVWLTEMEIGSSWGTPATNYEQYRKYLQVLLQRMEECDWIERYAIYATDYWTSYMFYEANSTKGLTPAGQVYRDHRSTFAYHAEYTKTPTWWAPSAKTPTLVVKQNTAAGTLTFQLTNPNTDMTDKLVVERRQADGSWATFAEVTERWRFDSESITLAGVEAGDVDIEMDQFRATVTTLTGAVVSSSTTDTGYILNPRIETDSKTAVDGWTCTRDADNGYTKATGDTYFEVWDATAANISFDYYQELTELEDGVYELSANVFNTVDNVDGSVNGAVGLYAQTADQLYFAPVTTDANLDAATTDIGDLDKTSIGRIIVDGGTLRVGVRNLGTMGARWAGADNFLLRRTGDLATVDIPHAKAENDIALYALMPALQSASDGGEVLDAEPSALNVPRNASRFIVNPDCNRQSSYGWTTSNIDVKTDAEAYDAVATNTYWNIWKSGAYESSMTQVVRGLPEGTYVLSAILRGQETATMTLAAATPTATVSQPFVGTSATSAPGAAYHQGWQLVQTEPIEVQRGQQLTISLSVKASATAWWSADHFALTLVDIPGDRVGIHDLGTDTPRPATQNNVVYDLAGRALPATTALPQGIYLVGGRKIMVQGSRIQ